MSKMNVELNVRSQQMTKVQLKEPIGNDLPNMLEVAGFAPQMTAKTRAEAIVMILNLLEAMN